MDLDVMKSSTPRYHLISPALVLALLVSTVVAAQTQVYKYRDENGNVVFSDRVPNQQNVELEAVEVPVSNSAQPPPEMPATRKKTTDSPSAPRYAIAITSPPDGTTIPMGPGNFVVTTSSKPGLTQGDLLQLKIDGAMYGEPQSSGTWKLQNVYRGEHSLVVERVDYRGKVLHRASPITVYVLRPSIR
tara:strand:- start:132 stop:695 length:564 start_codon:yes stop_codon:yes gene_type:complete